MDLITAPSEKQADFEDKLFLAGGITNCPNWQKQVINYLNNCECEVTLFNPRRDNFDINDPTATEVQIAWEHRRLREATMIMFWFPQETLCPIVLFELGAHLERDVKIRIGCHPNYKRIQDVRIQSRLSRPHVKIYTDFFDLLKQMRFECTCKPL